MTAIENVVRYTERLAQPSKSIVRGTHVRPKEQWQGFVSGGLRRSVFWDRNQWVASEEVTDMFGEGDTPDDALYDLAQSLHELRGHLEHYEVRLTNSQADHLALLRRYHQR